MLLQNLIPPVYGSSPVVKQATLVLIATALSPHAINIFTTSYFPYPWRLSSSLYANPWHTGTLSGITI